MEQQTVRPYQQEFVYASFRLQPEKLHPLGMPTREEWCECGRFLRLAEGNVHFWIGDWLIYGQAHFKQDYEEAIDLTGYSYNTLRKDKYTAERIPPERRRANVDVAIHQEVASLPPLEFLAILFLIDLHDRAE
jgi:hypothetical protein